MVIVVCKDDNTLLELAKEQSKENSQVFGKCYQVFKEQIPLLKDTEKLFIGAHGAREVKTKNPEIGDKAWDGLHLNAPELYENIKHIFPKAYQGEVFIYACESADYKYGSFSFAEAFRNMIQADHSKVKVYGQKGDVGLKGVVGPDDKGWVEATI